MNEKDGMIGKIATWWREWGSIIIANLVLVVVEYVWFSRYSTPIFEELLGEYGELNLGWAVFFSQLLYNILSFKIVGPTELGNVLFFGKPLYDVESGLNFVPFLVYKLVRGTRNIIEIELPARPELIFRSEIGKEEVVPKDLLNRGYKPPIRVQFGAPDIKLSTKDLDNQINDPGTGKDELKKLKEIKTLYNVLNGFIEEEKIKEDPLNVRMTAETPLVVRLRIKKLGEFLKTFGSLEKVIDQIQDIAVAMLNREFSKITPAVAQAHLGTFSELIKEEIVERIVGDKSDGGIKIVTVLLRPFVYSHDLNKDLLRHAQARANKRATIIDAEAQKEKDTLRGQGEGAGEKAILDGRTEGILNMVEKLRVSPELIINTETARKITENPGQKTVIAGSEGFNNLMAIGSAFGETFRGEVPEKGKEKKEDEKKEKKDKEGKEDKK